MVGGVFFAFAHHESRLNVTSSAQVPWKVRNQRNVMGKFCHITLPTLPFLSRFPAIIYKYHKYKILAQTLLRLLYCRNVANAAIRQYQLRREP
jgi:hypothetical protein